MDTSAAFIRHKIVLLSFATIPLLSVLLFVLFCRIYWNILREHLYKNTQNKKKTYPKKKREKSKRFDGEGTNETSGRMRGPHPPLPVINKKTIIIIINKY